MDLSNKLVSQFAKAIKQKNKKAETTVYGTVIENNGSKFVKIDGSDYLTPISTTVEAVSGERVTVLIKNHEVVVTGNLTSPAARSETVNKIDNRTTPSKLVDLLYPVGSIYMSVLATSPVTLFGGSWEQIKDTFLLASGTTYLAGNIGGKSTNVLTAVNLPGETVVKTTVGSSAGLSSLSTMASGTTGFSSLTDISGSSYGSPIDNMPPYLVVYVWKRIE